MVRFQNRRNRTRWTSDVFWIMRSAIGTLPGLAKFLVGQKQPRTTQWRRGCCSCTAEMRGKCVLKNIKIFKIKIFVFPSVDKSSLCCVQLISYLSSPRHVVPYRATCHLFSIILQAKASSC